MSTDNGPITGTGISVVTNAKWSLELFFQHLEGQVDSLRGMHGEWFPQSLKVTPTPLDASPLASITYQGGKETRLYYLDTEYVVQEFCFTEGKGWYPGEIGALGAKATPGSGLAATVHGLMELGGGDEGEHIRVYYQEAGSHTIKELANDGNWQNGDLNIKNAFGGTSLAAVTYFFDRQTQIRVYYQAKNLCLKEYGHNGSGWFEGGFNPGYATAQTPLAALAFGGVELQVYWRDLFGNVVFARNTGSWGDYTIIKPIGPGYKFAVLQWDNGKLLQIYYQLFDRTLVGFDSNDGGNSWTQTNIQPRNST
jgi:hypothetical protein